MLRLMTSLFCAVTDCLLLITSGLATVKPQESQVIHEDSLEGRSSACMSKRKIDVLSAVLNGMSYCAYTLSLLVKLPYCVL
jgi:hypothetical protein